MACGSDAVGQAIRKCPFLLKVSDEQGEQYARNFATRPAVPASCGRPQPVFEERSCDFEATLRLFHGSSGVVPLARFSNADSQQAYTQPESRHHEHTNVSSTASIKRQQSEFASAPFASMSGAFNFLVSVHSCSRTCNFLLYQIAQLVFTIKYVRHGNDQTSMFAAWSSQSGRLSVRKGRFQTKTTAETNSETGNWQHR